VIEIDSTYSPDGLVGVVPVESLSPNPARKVETPKCLTRKEAVECTGSARQVPVGRDCSRTDMRRGSFAVREDQPDWSPVVAHVRTAVRT